jgi:hypothetical protein
MKSELQVNGDKPGGDLDVLVVYDGSRAGKGAKELCDRLRLQLPCECRLNLSLWSLPVLQVPSVARAAGAEAAGADVLVVAVNGDRPLPAPVRSWIAKCALRLPRGVGAVVAQLHGIVKLGQELSPAYGALLQIARDAGVGFFSEVIESADDELASWMERIHERSRMQTSLLEAVFQMQRKWCAALP